MKKCPECGNPSYDGAPVCGNCGYKFPKSKSIPHKSEDIFQKEPKPEKKSNDESTTSILKKNKVLIGGIILITLIVICGIVLTGSNNSNNTSGSNLPIQVMDVAEYSDGEFSFKYPNNWEEINGSDTDHPGAIFFKNDNNTIIEYYNVSSSSPTLKDVTQQRISYAQQKGAYVELVETTTLDGRNSSNILLEEADGNYTRFVSMFSDGELYVFKITGESVNSVTSDDVESAINSADIE